MSTTLASSLSVSCWTGIKHTGTPRGRIEPLGGLDTYISEPPASAASRPHKKVLLFLADAYGPLFINNKLLQDYFASRGFLVLGPDYFFGVPVQNLPSDRDKVAWSLEAFATAVEVFPRWFEELKMTRGKIAEIASLPCATEQLCLLGSETTKYVAVGYCFGAPFVLDLAAKALSWQVLLPTPASSRRVTSGGSVDPSYFRVQDDFTFPLEARRRAEDILVSNKSTYFFQVFSGVSHGFAVRGDPNVPHARWAKEESARGITEWFLRFVA